MQSKEGNTKIFTKRGPGAQLNKYTPSIIAKDLEIHGDITDGGSVEIEGTIVGNISSNSVTIREDGSVKGDIMSQRVTIKGNFDGLVRSRYVSISGDAKINGSIEYSSLSVEDGAFIDGQFKQIDIDTYNQDSKVGKIPKRKD